MCGIKTSRKKVGCKEKVKKTKAEGLSFLNLICLSVSSQVFEIYESLPDPSLQHMNAVVRSAVNICSGVYITFGLFGNIAASGLDIGGSNPFCR